MSIIILTNIHISDIIFTMITFKKLVVSSKNIHKLDVESSLLVDYANRNNIPTFVVSEKAIIRKKIEVDNTTLVAGSIPFVLSALRHLNIEIPKHNPYPIILKDYLNRNVWHEKKLINAIKYISTHNKPLFIKPAKGWKRFTGFVLEFENDYRLNSLSKSMPIFVSEPISFISEWRVYVSDNSIQYISHANFGGNKDLEPNINIIMNAINVLNENNFLAGYAIDFGVTNSGDTVLIEVNDGFSIGAYDGISSNAYWKVISSRWSELITQYNDI